MHKSKENALRWDLTSKRSLQHDPEAKRCFDVFSCRDVQLFKKHFVCVIQIRVTNMSSWCITRSSEYLMLCTEPTRSPCAENSSSPHTEWKTALAKVMETSWYQKNCRHYGRFSQYRACRFLRGSPEPQRTFLSLNQKERLQIVLKKSAFNQCSPYLEQRDGSDPKFRIQY